MNMTNFMLPMRLEFSGVISHATVVGEEPWNVTWTVKYTTELILGMDVIVVVQFSISSKTALRREIRVLSVAVFVILKTGAQTVSTVIEMNLTPDLGGIVLWNFVRFHQEWATMIGEDMITNMVETTGSIASIGDAVFHQEKGIQRSG